MSAEEDVTFFVDDSGLEGTSAAGRSGSASATVAALGAPLTRPAAGPSPFEVSLKTYPMQPWTARTSGLSQWFNYGLNPTTWTQYSLRQMQLLEASNAKFGAAGASGTSGAAPPNK